MKQHQFSLLHYLRADSIFKLQSSTQKKKQWASNPLELVKNIMAERKEEIKIFITSHFDQKTLMLVAWKKTSPNKNDLLDKVTENTAHRNINSTLSETVYIAFGHSIFCRTEQWVLNTEDFVTQSNCNS